MIDAVKGLGYVNGTEDQTPGRLGVIEANRNTGYNRQECSGAQVNRTEAMLSAALRKSFSDERQEEPLQSLSSHTEE